MVFRIRVLRVGDRWEDVCVGGRLGGEGGAIVEGNEQYDQGICVRLVQEREHREGNKYNYLQFFRHM